jgi:hypothetical protein
MKQIKVHLRATASARPLPIMIRRTIQDSAEHDCGWARLLLLQAAVGRRYPCCLSRDPQPGNCLSAHAGPPGWLESIINNSKVHEDNQWEKKPNRWRTPGAVTRVTVELRLLRRRANTLTNMREPRRRTTKGCHKVGFQLFVWARNQAFPATLLSDWHYRPAMHRKAQGSMYCAPWTTWCSSAGFGGSQVVLSCCCDIRQSVPPSRLITRHALPRQSPTKTGVNDSSDMKT